MGEETPYDIKNARLIELTEGRPKTARYVCALAYVDEKGNEYVNRQTVEGEIARAPRGITDSDMTRSSIIRHLAQHSLQ